MRGGQDVDPNDFLARSTVILLRKTAVCSGVVLGPHVVLTAAHCVSKNPDGGLEMAPNEKLVIIPGNIIPEKLARADVRFVKGAEVAVHPQYSGQLNNGKFIGKLNDIAFIFVKDGLPASLIANHLLWEPSSLKRDMKVQIAGFGQSEADKVKNSMILRQLDVAILSPFIKGPEQIMLQILDPLTGIVKGDSGGPAFFMNGEIPIVFGVASFGEVLAANEGAGAVAYEPLFKHLNWIRATATSFGVGSEVK
jgi:hypothetical protein